MINKLVASISGVFNKWGNLNTLDKFFYFLIGMWSIYGAVNLILLAQAIWVLT